LTALSGAASSRVLNLAAIAEEQADNEQHKRRPFFISPVLNRSIILKHRLRGDEGDSFVPPRATATKVIIPFEKKDLRVGGRSFFVSERNYDAMLAEAGNYTDRAHLSRDMEVLRLIDDIPSLDPFILREHLREHDILPDACYFSISPADQRGMFDFAAREVRRLTSLATGGKTGNSALTSGKMVAALLTDESNERLEPLRMTFAMQPDEFSQGIFSWRGFLYYKWSLETAWPSLIDVLKAVRAIRPLNRITSDEAAYLDKTKRSLIAAARDGGQNVRRILGIYDNAYSNLIDRKEPRLFRDFLLQAPKLFREMGETLGAMAHMTSFWRYRFPSNTPAAIDIDELLVIFKDFAQSLGIEADDEVWHP
jgi:hypothetical protein